MNPRTIDIDDTDTSEIDRIASNVRRELRGRMRGFRLVIHGHGLILHGWAHTYYVKQLAQHYIMTESQLPILANDIEVATSPVDAPRCLSQGGEPAADSVPEGEAPQRASISSQPNGRGGGR